MFDLTGKNALVTGATGGIGHAIARKLHAAGATVVISGTREGVLQDFKSELKDRVHVVAANLADTASVVNLFQEAEKATSQIDIVVCNAGITRDNLLIRMSEQEWDEVIQINLKSVWILNREAMKAMVKRRYGRIINISSIVGVTGNFGQTNYAASKAGIIGMTKSAAREGAARGVTVNGIAPGFIKTPMTEVLKPEIQEKIREQIPMASFGEPDDIAGAAVYLASHEAKYVTGQVIHVNGGMYL